MLQTVTSDNSDKIQLAGNPWETLVSDMLATGKFREDRLRQAGLLENLHITGCSVILPDYGEEVSRTFIYAHVARLQTKDSGWEEIGLAFVKEGYESNGYLGRVVGRLLANAPSGINFFGITKDLAVMKVFLRRGLVPVTKFVDPHVRKWASKVGIPNNVLPETVLLETPPDLEMIYADAKDSKTARRWLWRQGSQT